MKIIEVIPSFDVGGAERMASLLAVELARAGHEVAMVSLYNPVESWILREVRAAAIPVSFCEKRPGLDLRVVPRLGRLFSSLQADIIHTHLHTLKYVVPARLASSRARIVHTVHNLAQHEIEASGQAFQRAAFRLGVAGVAIGDAVAASISEVYGLPPKATIPNGIPLDAPALPAGTRERLRGEFGVGPDVPVFISVGRLNPQKDHRTLLAAFASAELRSLNAMLLVAGNGDLRAELLSEAARLGVAGRVHFLGVRSDIPALYAASDVFVLSSRYEGNPLVVMEAMAASLPVIATAVGSVPELVTPEVGRLVPANDPPALGSAMLALAVDRAQARKLGENARERAVERFDAALMARRYATLFDAIRKPLPRSGA